MISHKKYVTVSIPYPDLTSSTAVDLEGWRNVAIQAGPNKFKDATATPHLLGCGTSTGTFVAIVMDSTTDIGYSTITPLGLGVEALPRYLKISGGDSTVTAASGFNATVHLSY